MKKAKEADLGRPVDQYSTADFHIHGTVRSLFPYPMTEINQKNYLYLQDFCYMYTDGSYYSRQQGYRSYQLLYTYSGEAEMVYKGQKYILTPRTLFFADCVFPRSVRTQGDFWESSDLHFYGGNSSFLYERYFSEISPLFTIDTPSGFQTLLEEVLRAHTTISTYREWGVSSAIENLLLSILVSSPKAVTEVPERIQYLITYIENNYMQRLSVDTLAEFAGLSKYHLSREFKKYTGHSPYSYITELRMDRAKKLLRETSIPAAKIARIAGFEDESNFIRLFRSRTGMTPGGYRKHL